MYTLRLNKVSLGYGRRTVLKDIGLEARPGELVGIIGPNGSGKSTLIKGITRIISLESGDVFVDGHNAADLSRAELARVVAVLPQNATLPELFTAFEIVLMGRTPHQGRFSYESRRDIAIVQQAMTVTQTTSFAERRIGELSSGEKQRLLIARALAQEPKIVLLDEPTAYLDINYQIETLRLVHQLCREQQLVVVAALHDLNLAAQFCDRLVMLKDGQIYCHGTPQAVISRENIKAVYGADVCVYPHPVNDLPTTLVVFDKNEKPGQK